MSMIDNNVPKMRVHESALRCVWNKRWLEKKKKNVNRKLLQRKNILLY